jgi:alpha-galactosidase
MDMPALKVKKIVLIGAGSAMFTQGLVADLLYAAAGTGCLSGFEWELCLVDIDEEALDMVRLLAERMIQCYTDDLPVRLSWSTDRKKLLRDADVVVSTIGVGKRRAWEDDVFIPRRYGIYQPVGDTVMPGGISRAMRMIPATIDIARDIAQLCPKAIFVNYANPMTANCWATYKETGVRMVGLCHGVNHIEGYLADQAGVLAGAAGATRTAGRAARLAHARGAVAHRTGILAGRAAGAAGLVGAAADLT